MVVDGRYVEEAVNVFEIRVQACQQRHEDHLHVYVSFYEVNAESTLGLLVKEIIRRII